MKECLAGERGVQRKGSVMSIWPTPLVARGGEVTTAALILQTAADGLVRPGQIVSYWLVAGRIAKGRRDQVRAHFEVNGWPCATSPGFGPVLTRSRRTAMRTTW